MSSLIVLVRGKIPADLNNPTNQTQPGYIATFVIDNKQTLSAKPVKTPAAVPYSIVEDETDDGLYLVTDVTTGFAVWQSGWGSAGTLKQGDIPGQMAVSPVPPCS